MRYRIVNKTRFITFVLVVILGAALVISALVNVVSAAAVCEPKCIEVTVVAGDTLWAIAREYGPANEDIRKTVYDICELNDIEAGAIYAGQVIRVPVE